MTPAAGALCAALSLAQAIRVFAAGPEQLAEAASLVLLLAMGLSVALLGPGAFSVDARLFGRREIVVPRARRPEAPRGG